MSFTAEFFEQVMQPVVAFQRVGIEAQNGHQTAKLYCRQLVDVFQGLGGMVTVDARFRGSASTFTCRHACRVLPLGH